MANDQEKEAAARASLRFIKDGQVVGLGTGSTAAHFIQLLGEQVKQGLHVRGIPTSVRSKELAESLGIPLTTLDECQEIAVTVDGADEDDPQLRRGQQRWKAVCERIFASPDDPGLLQSDRTYLPPHCGRPAAVR